METATELRYQSGFGNEFASEAIAGALPTGRNSPQRAPHGLFAEQLSGTAFTTPRGENRRSWLYRIRPSAAHPPFEPLAPGPLRGTPFDPAQTSPNRLRWDPLPLPERPVDFVDGCATLAGNGDLWSQTGLAVHLYACTASMERYVSDSDGELLFVPQLGRVRLHTEFGILDAAPGQIALVPRGVRFRVELRDPAARGYVGENYGVPFRLPELGPIGSNGLANPRDFRSPVAAYEQREGAVEVVLKFGGRLWRARYDHSPLDVVAWHGTYAPFVYDLARFNTIGSVSFDHPDPSIYTVLTSPSTAPGTANADFVIFPPRWLVATETFRPPWFHRNVMSELMGLIHGVYDAKAEGFAPGGASLHNALSAHGPDVATFERASSEVLAPRYLDDTLAFMFESRYVFHPTAWALALPQLQADYDAAWQGFHPAFGRIGTNGAG